MPDAVRPAFNLSSSEEVDRLPLVSVVMPSLNQGRFIEQSIRSVLDQSYLNIELIVIDGGSSDDTVEILRRYDQSMAYWQSRPDRGQSHALNQGYERATGEILAWLNADDLLLPGAVAAAVDAFLSYPAAQVVFGDWISIDAEGKTIEHHYAFDMSRFHFLLEGFTCNSQAMFWRHELHKRFGEFDEALHRTMDYDMILRFSSLAPSGFHRIDRPLAAFRRHKDQKTTGSDSPVVVAEHERIAARQNLSWKFSLRGQALRPLYRLRRAVWYLRRGGFMYLLAKVRGRTPGPSLRP